jgi:hypothetical protein
MEGRRPGEERPVFESGDVRGGCERGTGGARGGSGEGVVVGFPSEMAKKIIVL